MPVRSEGPSPDPLANLAGSARRVSSFLFGQLIQSQAVHKEISVIEGHFSFPSVLRPTLDVKKEAMTERVTFLDTPYRPDT